MNPEKSRKVCVQPDDILFEYAPQGEHIGVLPDSTAIKPRHFLTFVPRRMFDRIQKAFLDIGTKPEGFTIGKALQFADYLVSKDSYLKQQAYLRPQDRSHFAIHQKSLEDWARDENGRPFGDPPIGHSVSKIIRFFLNLELIYRKKSKSGHGPSYKVGRNAAHYRLDESIYLGPIMVIQVPFKSNNPGEELPQARVLKEAGEQDKDAALVIQELHGLEVDWAGLQPWLVSQSTPEIQPTLTLEARKALRIHFKDISYRVSPYGRHTHNMVAIQGGVRSFIGFRGYHGKAELDISSSHSTLFYLFLKDLLSSGPGGAVPTPGQSFRAKIWRDNYTGIMIPSKVFSLERLADPLPLSLDMDKAATSALVEAITALSTYLWASTPEYRTRLSEELGLFRSVVLRPGGGVYADAQAFLVENCGIEASIESLKVATLAFYCGPNYGPPEPDSSIGGGSRLLKVPLYWYFRRKYPHVLEALLMFKHGGIGAILPLDVYDPDAHKVFTRLCMNLESDIVLHRIAPLMKHLDIPFIPIHDGMEVPLVCKEAAMKVFGGILAHMGLEGHYKVKVVDKSNPRPFRLDKVPVALKTPIELEKGAIEFDPAMEAWRIR